VREYGFQLAAEDFLLGSLSLRVADRHQSRLESGFRGNPLRPCALWLRGRFRILSWSPGLCAASTVSHAESSAQDADLPIYTILVPITKNPKSPRKSPAPSPRSTIRSTSSSFNLLLEEDDAATRGKIAAGVIDNCRRA
jgi:hypothetical protein